MNIETIAVAELSLDPSNVRKHSRRNLDAIKASLRKFGQQKPIVVDVKGIVLAGNGTLTAAKELGWTEIQATRTELAGVEATAFAIADNRTAELAEWDEDGLAKVLESLKVEDADLLAATGYDAAEVDKMVGAEVTEDEVPEPPAEPITKAGDLWLLGDHRLLCGDSTKAEDVERLMAGAKAEMLWADPPFGINYTGHGKSKDGRANKFVAIEGDDVPRSEWLANCLPASGAIYVKTTWSVLEFWNHAISVVCDLRSHIVWDRCSHSAGDVTNGYATQSEIILFGSIGKHSISRFDTDVWTIPRATTGALENRTGHPYESPVKLLVRAIENSIPSGAIVLDPFIGSGTCMIAAEQLGRKCYGMEISPAYCDVIVNRWEKLTGRKAVIENRTQ